MKAAKQLLSMGMRQIVKDGMLFIMLPAPFLVGLIFKMGLPIVDDITTSKLSFSIAPWYGLADGLLASLTPLFVAILAGFLILDERDQGVTEFYQITPIAGELFIWTRLGVPLVWGFVSTVITLFLFNLTSLSFANVLALAVIGTLTGVALAMLMVSVANNRVEGLAVSKLMGISFLGLVFVWFVPAPYHYMAAFLPSYWVGYITINGVGLVSVVTAIVVCVLWIGIFTRKFLNRMR